MVKRWATHGHVQFDVECDIMQYENKVETTIRIHLQNLWSENNFEGLQKPSQKDHLRMCWNFNLKQLNESSKC